jgi:HK97 family phage prohead protease
MMLFGGQAGELELRASERGGFNLRGSFPYNKTAVLSDGGRKGRPRKERIRSGAFRFRVEDPGADIHLLFGHNFGQPLASKLTRTLTLRDTDEALTFEARVTAEIAATTYAADLQKLIAAGIVTGLSPGFRLPPERAVKVAEELEDEELDPANGMYRALIRNVLHALLFEISVVTSGAYPEAQVEARNWNLTEADDAGVRHALNRWRA